MALMKCPDCGRSVSSRIDACPTCGCPASDFEVLPVAAAPQPVPQPAPQPVPQPAPQPAPTVQVEAVRGEMEKTTLVFPQKGPHMKYTDVLLKQAGAKEPLAKVQWNDRMTLKLDRPVKLELCGERGRGPGSGIGQLVVAQVMQIAALWFGEVGILFFVLSLLWVVTGILDICKCGPRTVVSFLAEPGKRYWLHWTDYERMRCEEDHAVEE